MLSYWRSGTSCSYTKMLRTWPPIWCNTTKTRCSESMGPTYQVKASVSRDMMLVFFSLSWKVTQTFQSKAPTHSKTPFSGVWEWDELSASYLDLFVVDGEFEIRERLSWNDPGVSEHLGSCPPLHGVYVQHAEDKVLGWGRNWVPVSSGETDFALTNPRQNLLGSVLRTSRKGSAAKGGRVTVYNAWTITDGFHLGRATFPEGNHANEAVLQPTFDLCSSHL